MATHPVFTSHEPLPRLPGWRSGGTATWVAVLFVVLSLMALVFVPWLIDRRLAVIRSEVSDVLEPARVFATQLEVAQLRELAALRGYLLTGDRRYLETSDEARLAGESAYEGLSSLTESMDPAVRARILDMWNLVTDTRMDFQPLLSGEMGRAQALALFPQVEELFTATQTAAADIRDSIMDLEGRARGRMARASEVEFWTTVFLAVLAFAATLVLGLLGVRLRRLVRESERRRRDAVWSRREVDALVAATADGVFSVDHDGRCTSVNPAGMDLLGYTSRDLLGRDLHALMLHSHPRWHAVPTLGVTVDPRAGRGPDGGVGGRERLEEGRRDVPRPYDRAPDGGWTHGQGSRPDPYGHDRGAEGGGGAARRHPGA